MTRAQLAALAGFGLAYVPEDLAQPHLAKGRLTRVLEAWCPPYSGPAAAIPHRPSACWSMRCATEAETETSVVERPSMSHVGRGRALPNRMTAPGT